MQHSEYMKEALIEARKAYDIDEVPIGAIIVHQGKIIARAHNQRENRQEATAHAEKIAIEEACRVLKSWRLHDCTLYVTLEPCMMCTGASILSRIDTIVYGAHDPKGGLCGSNYDFSLIEGLNHYPKLVSGICEEECQQILRDFFKNKRINKTEKAR